MNGFPTTGAGLVDARSARIWFRANRAELIRLEWSVTPHDPDSTSPQQGSGSFELRFRPGSDGTTSFVYPDEFVGGTDLPPHSRIEYRILGEAGVLGIGRFDTAPSSPLRAGDEFSIALFSCHQPFDDTGHVHEYAKRALGALPEIFERYSVRRVLALGDQMYVDSPPSQSLYEPHSFQSVSGLNKADIFACTREEVRALFHERYRKHFGVNGFDTLISGWATTMMLDDHEVVDNFGTDPDHASVKWHNIREGGLDAAFDYEALRQQPPSPERPDSFHYSWEFGPLATFVMDLRSQRVGTDQELQFFGPDQLDALRGFLALHEQSAVVVLGLSVPLAFLPEKFVNLGILLTGEGSDVAERWWNERATKNRTQLLEVLSAHRKKSPSQLLLIATGDVHVGMVNRLRLEGGEVLQIISSALSNREGALQRAVTQYFPLIGSWTRGQISWDFLENRADGGETCAGLNVGLISVRTNDDGSFAVILRIVLLGEETGPKVVFESSPLNVP